MKFWLGTHHPHWLERADVGLMVSHRWLTNRRTLPRAVAPWVLDSGGFTELSLYGRWTVAAEEYVDAVYRYQDRIGRLEWVAPQDWMCEPFITAKTGKTVAEHQELTIENYLKLTALGPDLPFIPVVQGFTLDDYHQCVDLYYQAGVDLAAQPLVGIGSVCRRQGTSEASHIIRSVADRDIRLHGFGLKLQAIDRLADVLTSADSMAWSFDARRAARLHGCSHKSCANCLRYALRWRDKVERRHGQPRLFTT